MTTTHVTAQNFTCSIQAPVSASDAYDKIAHVSEWWAKDFEGSAGALGDTFTVRFGETFVDFRVSKAVPGRKLVWEVTDCRLPWLRDETEWNGTRVAWDITAAGETTTVTLTHEGLVPEAECYGTCEKGWNHHVRNSLLPLLTEGRGNPS